jgi:hypothetical protein
MQVSGLGLNGVLEAWCPNGRRLIKRFDSTKQKYNHLFKATTFLTNFLHRRHQDFTIEIIGEHQNNLVEHGWYGEY